ncbi:junctophilin-1-like isoform X1 [Biomphalaria glabrata]|uniref:Junctophilin-1-like isoform X1 n=3 Tax=Biomphalaria glabrata TaxID=6526 RepID=A0A9W3AZX7_BIOGL|nr:junctophilin-1-like isoform X1 [Biomphalaria glabrata]XP_055892773.1 junctophilin-1-like isoform X1 [Biomphalaria glabrata]XP_055892774.1 junctophilin-1-like isoform X1 [Biomphalaria glabrata]XP_055892775.1 junctophilin-1-like isoform X1 [Biomphalaria glabrata]
MTSGGGRFDFDDGGTYCGGWEDGKAHGNGVCTGPKGQGEYAGAWQYGFEVSGVYTWPSGNAYKGQWFQGKRHGLGVENKGRWIYKGEWTQGFKGRYGVRASTTSGARYEGTWTTGLQDGYGCESYADGDHGALGTYQGQWYRGTRHGYGVRQSVPYGLASHYRPKAMRASLTSLRSENEDELVVKSRDKKLDESRGGFVLKAKSDETPPTRRRSIFDKQGRSSLRKTLMSGLKLKKQKSTGDINDSPKRQTGSVRSTISNISHVSADSSQSGVTTASVYTDSNLSFVSQDDITDVNVVETYMGEWKNDKRSGFGISERSDGLKYEGEWYNNRKYGYGVTTFKDGTREEGKYKNNVLISSGKKNKLFLIRTSKLRERVDNAVLSAQRAGQIALQKADIAITRMANARAKAEAADQAAERAQKDSDLARLKAKEYAPEFHQPGTDIMRKQLENNDMEYDFSHVTGLANHQPFRSKSLNSPHAQPNFEGQDPSGLTALTALHGEPGGHRLPNDYGNHPQLLNIMPGGPGGGGEQNQALNVNLHSRSPSLKVRRYSFLAGSRRGRGFSEIFNSTILNDHFDQYAAADSGIGGDSLGTLPNNSSTNHHGNNPHSYSNHNPRQRQPSTNPSPDSGVSDTMEDDTSKIRSLQRRRTMPCIVDDANTARNIELATAKQKLSELETARSNDNLTSKNTDTFIIENGIRKRIQAEVHSKSNKETMQLPKEYRIVPASDKLPGSGLDKRGSLPDLKNVSTFKPMSRREAYQLGTARREEIRRLQELAERRRQGDMSVILGDVRDWCQERQLLVLVIALNLSLATMFFNLLS